jgi:hypothetical protein
MDDAHGTVECDPAIELEQTAVEPDGERGRWIVEWRIRNTALRELQIDSVRLPHGQFKAEEERFEPALLLASGQEARFKTRLRCDEPPGLVTENAFLIFHALWLGQPWRIFVRVRVLVRGEKKPFAEVALITTQKVGFSGVSFR